MDENFATVFTYIHDIVIYAFAEASIFGFVIGLIFFMLGLIIILATIYVLLTGKRVSGKVVGAVKDIRFKEKNRNGKVEKERKETLFTIFEYVRPDGALRQEKSSNGGSSVLKYKTGQKVDLIIVPSGQYDDVYDVNDHTAIIMGTIFAAMGFGIMLWAANTYTSLGVSALTLVSIIVVFIFRVLTGKKKKPKTSGNSKHYKEFDPADVRPIEDFIYNK